MKTNASLLAAALLCAPAALADDAPVTYIDHVRPILQQHCFTCHGPDKQSGGLNLSNYAALMGGGSAGEIVAPQDPSGSSLVGVMDHTRNPTMPPNQPAIDAAKIEVVRQWIAQGCRETADSAARAPSRPAVDLSVGEPTLGRPVGPPIMPRDMPLGTITHTPGPGAVAAVAGHPWSPIVAVAGQQQVLVYHTDTLELLGVLPFELGQPEVIRFSGTGRLLMAGGGVGGQSGGVVVWDVESGSEVARVGEETDAVLAADIDPMHRFVALGGPAKVVKVFDLATGEMLYRIEKHTEWITAVAFSPDGILLATADRNGGVHVWEAETGAPFHTLGGHDGRVTQLAWRYDGNVLASVGEDGQARLWEMNGGSQVKAWGAHGGGVQSVAFGEDGRLVTTGRDRRIKIWDANGNLARELAPFSDIALAAAFDTSGRHVIAGDLSGRLARWTPIEGGDELVDMDVNPAPLAQQMASWSERESAAREALSRAQAQHAGSAEALSIAQAGKQEADRQLAAAQQEVDGRRQAMEQASAIVAQQTQQRDAVRGQVAEMTARQEQVQQSVVALAGQMRQTEQEHAESAAQRDAMSQEAEQANAAAEAARQAAAQSPDDAALQEQAQQAGQVAEEKGRQLAEQEQRVQRAAEQVAQAAQQHAAAETAMQEVSASLDPLRQQLEAAEQELASATGMRDQAQQALAQAEQQVPPATQRQAETAQQVAAAQATHAGREAARAAAEQEHALAARRVAKWRSAELRLELDAMRDELAQLRAAEHPAVIADEEAALALEGVRGRLTEAEEALATGPQRVERQQERIAAAQQQVEDATAELARREQAATQRAEMLASHRQAVESLAQQAEQAQDDELVTQALTQARAALATLEQASSNAAESMETMSFDLEDAQFEYESAVAAMDRLNEEITGLPTAIEALRVELAQQEQVKQQAEQQLAEARAPGDALEARLNEQLPRYAELRAAAGFAVSD